MKSKRARLDRRNAERRVRREQKLNPPSLMSKILSPIWTSIMVFFIISLYLAYLYPLFMDPIPGPEGTDLIPYTAERMATLLLFVILATSCIIGFRALYHSTKDSSSKVRPIPAGIRIQILRASVLLFFAVVFVVSGIICWAQLKAMVDVVRFLLQ